jgi:glyoxylate/succinic semialdehyde reductase
MALRNMDLVLMCPAVVLYASLTTPLHSTALKGPNLMSRDYPPAFPLKHQQKDLRLALALG